MGFLTAGCDAFFSWSDACHICTALRDAHVAHLVLACKTKSVTRKGVLLLRVLPVVSELLTSTLSAHSCRACSTLRCIAMGFAGQQGSMSCFDCMLQQSKLRRTRSVRKRHRRGPGGRRPPRKPLRSWSA